MKLLLDTSVFLWWITDSDRLSRRARELIADGANDVWFSVVSGWEIVIKAALKRIGFPGNADSFIPEQLAVNSFEILPIHLRHVLRIARLPAIHQDPFDRMLIAQALEEKLTILSADRQLARYPAPVAW